VGDLLCEPQIIVEPDMGDHSSGAQRWKTLPDLHVDRHKIVVSPVDVLLPCRQ
jgi:hypothetical protein